MYEYQRRLLNEAAKHGKLSPKETQNLPEECRDFIVEGVNVMKGAEKLVLNSGLDVGTYRKLLNVLRNRLGGHAMILDITKPTGPGAARGGLTGEGSEIKIVKIADIGKYEFNGYDFKGIKLGNKAERTWKDHKGQAIIIALNESVQEEAEVEAEAISESDFQDIAKHNLEVSTKLALKKDKKHDSQWGVGYRGYLRLVVGGRAISKQDVPSGKSGEGWNTARNDIITGKKLNEEVENLEEMTGKEAANILNGVRSVKVVKPVKFANLETGKTYNMSVQGAHANPSLPGGDKLYVLTSGAKRSGKIISTNLAKAIKAGDLQIVKEETETNEAYAPNWAYAQRKQHPILGQFKHKGNTFEYRAIVKGASPGSDWALSHGMTHEIFLRPVWNDYRDVRFAIVKATVVQVAVDEGEGGKPVYEKWPITGHRKYPTESTEIQTNEAVTPNWAKSQAKQNPILGQFKYKNETFEYRAVVKGTPDSDWALKNGLYYEVFMKPMYNDHRDVRFANIKRMEAYIAVDKGDDGKPVLKKLDLTMHQRYPEPKRF
jgi:hypothetical protein